MKKIVATILSIVLIISICPFGLFTITADAASDGDFVVDGVVYKLCRNSYVTVIDYTDYLPDEVVIPSNINGYPVLMIEDCAFENSDLESVVIPNSVWTIGNYAFDGCYWLESVTIGKSVNHIYSYAFRDTAIQKIIVPGSVQTIDNGAFSDCEYLHTVILQEGVETLYYNVFNYCTNLQKLCIPQTVNKVYGDYLGYLYEEDLTIYGYKDTVAEELASIHECSFEEIQVTALSISESESKKEYLVGTDIKSKDIKVYATYSYGETFELTAGYNVSGFNSEKIGAQTIVVSYGGKECSFDIVVCSKAAFAESIKISKLPSKTEYIMNEENFDSSGGEIEITYKDGSKEFMPLSNDMIQNFGNETIGLKSIVVKFGICECAFEIKVVNAATKHIMVSINEIPTYNGGNIELTPDVTLYGKKLVMGVDYTLSFSNNVNATNDAKMIVTGINNYWGFMREITFPIRQADIKEADIVVQSAVYSANVLEPKVTVRMGGVELVQDLDFVVQYINNFYVGTGTARIIGIGNYRGYYDAEFEISERETSFLSLKGLQYSNGELYDNDPQFVIMGDTISGSISATSGYCKIYHTSLSGEFRLVYTQNYTPSSYSSYNRTYPYEYLFTEPGRYDFYFDYDWCYSTGGYVNSSGVFIHTAKKGSEFKIYEVWCEVPPDPEDVIAAAPVEYGVHEAYLHVESDDTLFAVCNPIWSSSDPTIATVENGIVKFKKNGTVDISATVGECTATWQIDNEPLDITKNTTIFYDNEKNKYNVFWNNEPLIEGTDYTVNITKKHGVDIVKITGINLFSEEKISLFYENSNYLYLCEHEYDHSHDRICNICEEVREIYEHDYTNACDTDCNAEGCSHTREITHNYEWVIDEENTCGKDGKKHQECTVCNAVQNENTVIPATGDHTYSHDCDAECNVCEFVRDVPDHVYDNACDTQCNICEAEREVPDHVYDNACDAECNICEAEREVPDHIYDDDVDPDCNVCDDVREITYTGWYLDGANWLYYVGGEKATGWQYINYHWYYFNTDGIMQTGWLLLGNTWYFLADGGNMVTGWQHIGNFWYYFHDGGNMATGWLNLGGTWYFLADGGNMVTGWQRIGNFWYYFHDGGNMATGWLNLGGTWYYLAEGGNMVTGWLLLGNTWYYFADGGNMLTGWQLLGGNWYLFADSGAWIQ